MTCNRSGRVAAAAAILGGLWMVSDFDGRGAGDFSGVLFPWALTSVLSGLAGGRGNGALRAVSLAGTFRSAVSADLESESTGTTRPAKLAAPRARVIVTPDNFSPILTSTPSERLP